MMFGCLHLTVWIHSVTSELLITVGLIHFYKVRPCSMWIWGGQVLFKIEYDSIPKNWNNFVCLIPQIVLKKNGFVVNEDSRTTKHNSTKKAFRSCTSGDWYRYKYMTRIFKYRTFTAHLRLILWMWASLTQKQKGCTGARAMSTTICWAQHCVMCTAQLWGESCLVPIELRSLLKALWQGSPDPSRWV